MDTKTLAKEKLEYKIEINAPAKKVWECMLGLTTYMQWTHVSWPNSTYEGKWEKGEKIRFHVPGEGGTLAIIDKYEPYKLVLTRHIAILLADGSEDTKSEGASGWIGSTEQYAFDDHNGKTALTVTVVTYPAWKPMFDEGWPPALKKLKEICEQ